MKIVLASLVILATLSANPAHAGSMAPAPRVIAKYERDFMVRSGAQTLQELLNTGIVRYFLTGGQSLLVLVNGRPYATTAGGLDTLPLSAIERIELLSGDSLGTFDGSAVRGALNVVLRSDLDGFEARALTRLPSQEGGDGRQGSVFWGGTVGEGGRLSVGVDLLDRQEITSQSREYSRSEWQEGGTFNAGQNISVGGNTVWIIQRNEDGRPTGVRSVALGKCDLADGYTGSLSNPPGLPTRPDDQGCGFAYGTIAWETSRDERKTAVLNFDVPLSEATDFHVDAIVTQGDSAFRYAPSVGTFVFRPNEGLLQAINEAAADSGFEADPDDWFVGAHRFVGHGNRDWRTDTEEYDVSMSLEGRIREGLGYDVRLSAFGFDGYVGGDTFVHEDQIAQEIRQGNYDLANPFSSADAHLTAIEHSSLRLENPYESKYQEARLALEGSGFAIGGRDSAWTAGVEVGHSEARDITIYRSNDGTPFNVSNVLGSGGFDYAGEREFAAAFAETSVPLREDLDLRAAGRRDEYDDVGGMTSWRVGADYRPNAMFTLRGAFSAGQQAPSFLSLHATEYQDHPYVDCDPGTGSPPRTCTELNPLQVTRVTTGNPELDPLDAERLTIGAEARRGPFFVDVEWYRHSRSGGIGRNSANWAIRNLPECPPGEGTKCIERATGDITIHDRYANVVDWDLSGLNTRLGGGFRTRWGVVGLRGAWRRVTSAELRIAGEEERYAIPRNIVRLGALARRGSLSAVWTTSYRSSFENTSGTGTFKSWTGHDVVLDWSDPLGVKGGRVTGGVFNLTDAGLSVNTANPSSVDGPTEAGWGRTFFLSLNMQF